MTCAEVEKRLLAADHPGDLSSGDQRSVEQHMQRCPACRKKAFALQQVDRVLADVDDVPMPDEAFFEKLHDSTLAKITETQQTVRQSAPSRRGFFATLTAIWRPALGMISVVVLSFVVWEVFQEQTAELVVADIPATQQMRSATDEAVPDAPQPAGNEESAAPLPKRSAVPSAQSESVHRQERAVAGESPTRPAAATGRQAAIPAPSREPRAGTSGSAAEKPLRRHLQQTVQPRRNALAVAGAGKAAPLRLDEAPLQQTELSKRKSISGVLSTMQQNNDSENHSYAETMRKHNELLDVNAQIGVWQDYLESTPDTSAFYPHAVLHLARLYLAAAKKDSTPENRQRARDWLIEHGKTLKPLMGTREFESTLRGLQGARPEARQEEQE